MIVSARATPKLKYMLDYRVLISWTGRNCQEGWLQARSFWLKNILIWTHHKLTAESHATDRYLRCFNTVFSADASSHAPSPLGQASIITPASVLATRNSLQCGQAICSSRLRIFSINSVSFCRAH